MNALIEVLFITNIWISLYTNLLDFLNFLFPPVLREQFYRNPVAYPEPFETPLFLFLTLVFVFLIWLWHRYAHQVPQGFDLINKPPALFIGKIAILAILTALLFTKLGSFPLSHDSNPPYYIFFFFYILTLIATGSEIWIISRIIKNKKIANAIIFIIVALFLAAVTFEPRFPISPGEYAFFWGPIWEVSHGKTIYTDIPSQYGFLPILAFAILSKFSAFSLASLQITIWFLWVLEYFLIFYLLHKLTRSLELSLVGIFSVVTLNYLSFYQVAQSGPLRWFPIVFAIFLLYRFRKIDSKKLLFSLALLGLWFIDSGSSLILGYLTTLLILTLTKSLNLKAAVKAGIFLMLSYIGIIGLINLIHILLGVKTVDLTKIFFSLGKHSVTGLVMVPIEFRTYFWLFVFVYFTAIIYVFRNSKQINSKIQDTRNKLGNWDLFGNWSASWRMEIINFDVILLFSANLLLFASLYFVGRSLDPNLFNISIFAIVPTFLILGRIYSTITSKTVKFLALICLFFLFVVYPAFQRHEFITKTFTARYMKLLEGKIFIPEIDEVLRQKYSKEADLIKGNLKEEEVAILSSDDTYLLYLTGKKSLFAANPAFGIDTKSEMSQAIRKALAKCPIKIAIDCTVYKMCPSYRTLTGGNFIAPHLLSEMEDGCKVKYKPVSCTDKLCIASSKL